MKALYKILITMATLSISFAKAETMPSEDASAQKSRSSEYAYIYSMTSQTLPPRAAVKFDESNEITAGIKHIPGSSDITFLQEGTYLINFQVRPGSPSSAFTLFINNSFVPGSMYRGYGTYECSGQVIVKIRENDVLTLRYYGQGEESIRLSSAQIQDGMKEKFVMASITILKID